MADEKKDDYFMNNEIDPIKELLAQLSGERCAKWSEWRRYCANENELERLIPDVPGIEVGGGW